MPDDPTMLFNYAFSTDPAAMEISTAKVTNQARVNIGISAGTPVYCNRIEIAVPVGPDAASLFDQPPAGSSNTDRWALTTEQTKGGKLWDGLDPDQDYASFTYDCVSGADYLIDYNLVLGVFGAVNQVVGDVGIAIRENSGTTGDPSTFTQKWSYFPLRKDPPSFYLTNLVATTPDSPTVPCTDFANGAPIRLAWESNGTYFQLFVKGQTAPIYAGTATTFTLSGGMSRGTTFILTASMTGSPGQDTPQGGYEPIYLYDSLAVSVSNPVLTPTSVTVSDALSVAGTSTLGTTSTGALTSASATVSGGLQAGSVSTGGTLNVTGAANVGRTTVSGGLNVAGGGTLDGATVIGRLNGIGTATLANLTVRGLSGSAGRVALLGAGRMIAQGTNIATTGIAAQTDGFAVAQVLTPGNNGVSSFAYASLYTLGTWFQVQGGTVGSFGSGWSSVMNNNPNAITVPIQAGTTWYYGASNGGGNQADSPSQIWWFPMGTGASGPQTFRTLSAEEVAAAPPPPPPLPDLSGLAAREAAATDFVDQLAAALGTKLTDQTRSDLAQLLGQV